MAQYIEREAAIKIQCVDCGNYGFCDNDCSAVESIKRVPAADVRPVVLCRDCKHGQGEKMDFWNEYEGIECIGGVVHRKDWFCADGEKKEES